MTPTSVRPADVMCTRSLDKHPVYEPDDPEDQHCGAAATTLSFLLLFGDRRPRLGVRRRWLRGRRWLRHRRLGRRRLWRSRLWRSRLRGFHHPRAAALRDARRVIGRLEHEAYFTES